MNQTLTDFKQLAIPGNRDWRREFAHFTKWILFIAACCLWPSPSIHAQPPNPQPTADLTAESPNESPPTVPLPIDPNESLVSDTYIASVSMDGKVAQDRVEIEAVVEIVVVRGEAWHRVPLRFDQAHIYRWEYDGPGQDAPEFEPRANENGIIWLVKGIGKHQLKFSFWVPIRTTLAGSQLQLSLPPIPAQFDTQLKLTVPYPNAVLVNSPNLELRSINRDADQTLFDGSVTRNRLDLTWNIPQSSVNPISKVATQFHLRRATDALLLSARQTIELQRSEPRELIVQLPSDFELTRLMGPRLRSYSPIQGRTGWVRVQLNDETSNRLELNWLFRRNMADTNQRIIVDGLGVEGAAQELGTILIDEQDGSRVVPQTSENRFVYRIDLDGIEIPSSSDPNCAYEFLQQPFQLVHEIRPIEPLILITPIFEFDVTEDKLRLVLHQLLKVERGTVGALKLSWPELDKGSWKHVLTESNSPIAGLIQVDFDRELGQLNLNLPVPIRTGEYEHVLSVFERDINFGDQAELSWTLPKILTTAIGRQLWTSSTDDQLSLEFDGDTQAQLLPVANARQLDQMASLWELSPALQQRIRSSETRFLRAQDSQLFSAIVKRHDRHISGAIASTVLNVSTNSLLHRQQFELNVEYGRLETLSLAIPDALMRLIPDVDPSLALAFKYQGQELNYDMVDNQVRLKFPEPITGQFSFQVEFRIAISESNEPRLFDLPILNFTDIELTRLDTAIVPTEIIEVAPDDQTWVSVPTSPRSGAHWAHSAPENSVESIPLKIGKKLVDSSQQFIVETAKFWSHYDSDGICQTLARFDISLPPPRVAMTLPAQTDVNKMRVLKNGMPISPESIEQSASNPRQVVFELGSEPLEQCILEFEYRSTTPAKFRFAELQTFEFPQFADSVWVNESLWEVQLPAGHLLFVYPELQPLFNWSHNGIFWQREPAFEYSTQRNAFQESILEAYRFKSNFYAFQGFSPVVDVRFRAMNRSLILLIGAGFALTLGFLFYYFQFTRNVLSLIVLAFVVSLMSVWYLQPILLLLQPAILGVLLALTATLIDLRTRRRHSKSQSIQRQSKRRFEDSEIGDGTTQLYTPTGSSVSNLSRD